jgi:hypothetical protein
MSFNKISRARNLLNEARESIGKIQLDPEVYGSLLSLLVGVNDSLVDAVAILGAAGAARRTQDGGQRPCPNGGGNMKRISITAIAAILIATPAMACTDWTAIAMMDAALLSHGDKVLEFRGSAVAGPWVAALDALDRDADRTRGHIESALTDKCN